MFSLGVMVGEEHLAQRLLEKIFYKVIHLFEFYYLTNFILAIVHYRAWTNHTQHKFEDTWKEQQPIELVLGKGMWLSIMYSTPPSRWMDHHW